MTSMLDVLENKINNTQNKQAFDAAIASLNTHAKAISFLSGWTGPGIKAVDDGIVEATSADVNSPTYNGKSADVPDFAYSSYTTSLGTDHHKIYQSGANTFDVISVTTSAPSYGYNFSGSSVAISEDRALFHELAHGMTLQGYSSYTWRDVLPSGGFANYAEELAVFAENVFYAQNASQYRLGHIPYQADLSPTGGIVGNEIFLPYSNGPSLAGNVTSDIFTAEDSQSGITAIKTFYKPGSAPMAGISHYISDTLEFGGAATLLTTSGAVTTVNTTASGNGLSFVNSFLGDLMRPAATATLVGTINDALAAKASIAKLTNTTYVHDFTALSGISGQRFIDNDHVGSLVDIVGPVQAGGTIAVTTLEQNADDGHGTILIGASGFVGASFNSNGAPVSPVAHDFSESTDFLRGGDLSDILVAGTGYRLGAGNVLDGGGGDDVLIGGAADDTLLGGSGSDILIASPGSDALDGGDNFDVAYYGDLSNPISANGYLVIKPYANIDNLSNIEAIVGTNKNDTFAGIGTGIIFYGNGGDDKFIAGAGPDTFRGVAGVISGSISFSNLTTDNNVITRNATSLGHIYDQAETIIGSANRDIIDAPQSVVYAGAGNDEITVGIKNVFGEAGNDTFHINEWRSSVSVSGGSDEDTVDLSFAFSANQKINIDWAGATHRISTTIAGVTTQGAALVGIEKFTFSKDGPGVFAFLPTASDNSFFGTYGANDNVTGGSKVDELHAGGSDTSVTGVHNYLQGMGGNDVIYGATNANTNFVGDYLDGGSGDDIIWGSAGKDLIYGGLDTDRLHGEDGDDNFYDDNGTNFVWGGNGNDVLHLEGYNLNSLSFGTSGSWQYVAVNGKFIDYITDVERISTANGTVAVSALNFNRLEAPDQTASPDYSGNTTGSNDTYLSEDDVGDMMSQEVSLTNDGMFNLVSTQNDWAVDSAIFPKQGDATDFDPNIAGSADMFAQAIASNGYAGAGDMSLLYQQPDMIGMFPSAFQTPIHHDMLFM